MFHTWEADVGALRGVMENVLSTVGGRSGGLRPGMYRRVNPSASYTWTRVPLIWNDSPGTR